MSKDLVGIFSKLISDAKAKFDETCEVSMHLKMSPSDKPVRGFVDLPNPHGRSVRVLVFANGKVSVSDSDMLVSEDSLEKVGSGKKLEFDIAVAELGIMPKLGKIAKAIGPRGLMPNAKDGGVVKDVSEAIEAFKTVRVVFCSDKFYGLHVGIGKLSMGAEKLAKNFEALVYAVVRSGTQDSKSLIKSCHISSTMGKSYQVNISDLGLKV